MLDRIQEGYDEGRIMTRYCPICDQPLVDGDDVVAIMASKFKLLPSNINYAIEHPTRCINIIHSACYEDYYRETDSEDL